MLVEAFRLAYKAHQGQMYSDIDPYILHPVRVALRVAEMGGTTEMQAVALLHDVIEDTGIGASEIADATSWHVANMVIALTRQKGTETYREYIHRLCNEYSVFSDQVCLIKIADIADNLEKLPEAPEEMQGLRERYEWALGELKRTQNAGV